MDWLEHAISYNRSTPLGVIYDDKSIYLHFQHFFDDVLFVGSYPDDWLAEFGLADKNIDLGIGHLPSPRNAGSTKEFATLVKATPRRKYLLYDPLDPPYPVNPLLYIMNSPTIARAYEHKRYFRDEFSDLINLPDHAVWRIDDLDKAAYEELSLSMGKIVIQEVESSGSKGTFIVSTFDEFIAAVESLRKISYSGTVVVSQFVEGVPYSVQVCVTKYGIFTGGLQKQLVDSKYLSNLSLAGVTKWCGGELGGVYPEILKHRTQEIATVVGSELASHGYRGIFGIDLLVNDNDVYAIEINARLTGYSHILSDMQFAKKKIPFTLLHTLELGNYKYDINDLESLPTMSSLNDVYSYLILNNQVDGPQTIRHEIKNGLYEVTDNGVQYIRPSYSVVEIEKDSQVLIFCRFAKGDTVERGKRILKIIKKGTTMDIETNDIDVPAQELLAKIKKQFEIQD